MSDKTHLELAKSDLKAAEKKIPVWNFDSAVKTAQVHALIAIAEALEQAVSLMYGVEYELPEAD